MNRSSFLKLSAAATGAFAIEKIFGMTESKAPISQSFGIQLWSVRDDMAKDPKGVLKQLASYGYKEVESFAGEKNTIFWGMAPKEFKKYINGLGMKMHSAHYLENDLSKFEATAKDAAEAGLKILYHPWEGPDKTIDDYKNFATKLNEGGKICKKYGLKYGFHNHDFSFRAIDGVFPQDILMQNTDKATVTFELDLYWVVTAGQDPITWLKKYPNRFSSSHVKDRNKAAADNDNNASCVIGTGKIDYAKVLKVAKQNGMKYFNVEQEKWDEGTPLECAKMDAEYMKKLKF